MWITSYHSHHNHQDIATPKKRILRTLKKSAWNIISVVYYVNKTTCSYFDKNLFMLLYWWWESSSLKRQMTNLKITMNKIIPYLQKLNKTSEINRRGWLYGEIGLKELKPLYFSGGSGYNSDFCKRLCSLTVLSTMNNSLSSKICLYLLINKQ